MNSDLLNEKFQSLCWPGSQLESAVQSLSIRCHLISKIGSDVKPSYSKSSGESADNRMLILAEDMDLDVERVSCRYDGLQSMLNKVFPAIIRVERDKEEHFLAIYGASRNYLKVLSPSLKIVKIRTQDVIAELVCKKAEPIKQEICSLLEGTGVASKRREKAIAALLDERLAKYILEECWLLRQPIHRSFWLQIKYRHLHLRFIAMLTSHGIQLFFFMASWWLIGQAILGGHIDAGWLVAWVLLLITQIPLSLFTAKLQGSISIQVGMLLKRRLMGSALHIAPENIRHMGVGQILSRVYDSENIEAGALNGGFRVILGCFELVVASSVLLLGTSGTFFLCLIGLFISTALYLGRRLYLSRKDWTAQRLSMTHSLIEKMVGHRTRLIQQKSKYWHQGEDSELANYLIGSVGMDQRAVYLVALLPRLWLLLGIAGLAPVFIFGNISTAGLAVALGGVLLGYRAVISAMYGFTAGLNALVAWERVRDVFKLESVDNKLPVDVRKSGDEISSLSQSQPLCFLQNLYFSYQNSERAILKECNLSIFSGERVLLQGSSGSGKSTLANVISGIQRPTEGLLLINGYDSSSISEKEWRRLVASAPQFHENYVMGDSFLFNLLMGGEWPPNQKSIAKAYQICDELGLSPLLQRMPAGMLQTVGEMGWRLSHGEKSRLFIARALLQNAELVILDESFAALDPENLNISVRCVRKHARTLVVIAHP
ncbi:ATP-binding cassette domain-containing protein [Microbulbifer sp. TRSA002]|uniref:ATP-binding cassette domain-containing protein n=1 Tax=Microbulbifer sp. TRSA002 TaxID=3243382 RepID=UPI00403A558D